MTGDACKRTHGVRPILDPDRVAGCVAGVAIGDAMGMPVEFMTRQEIRAIYGRLDRFVAPRPDHIHAGMGAARITDDTEQTLAIIDALDEHGTITPEIAAGAYLKWADECDAFSSSVLGPSSRRALERLQAGEDPRTTGSSGDTVGAAMRVAPIGIVNAGDLESAAQECVMSCLPTHGVSIAIGGACAVACAVAAAVVAGSVDEIISAALFGAEYGESRGVKWAGATVAARIRLALRIVEESGGETEALDGLYSIVGVGMLPTELVATAIGIVRLHQADCCKATISAVNMGGDADTLASIVAAITGGFSGIGRFPAEWTTAVERVNRLDFQRLADVLVAVRERRPQHDGCGC
ncbi:MAG: ADP-ribosylglycohydrolase family protein [Clostridia bacterium]|nr:ADP-ribosylglycohydrolase family protein [Clostridia bacterium]